VGGSGDVGGEQQTIITKKKTSNFTNAKKKKTDQRKRGHTSKRNINFPSEYVKRK
jgi:hypothetical protein